MLCCFVPWRRTIIYWETVHTSLYPRHGLYLMKIVKMLFNALLRQFSPGSSFVVNAQICDRYRSSKQICGWCAHLTPAGYSCWIKKQQQRRRRRFLHTEILRLPGFHQANIHVHTKHTIYKPNICTEGLFCLYIQPFKAFFFALSGIDLLIKLGNKAPICFL